MNIDTEWYDELNDEELINIQNNGKLNHCEDLRLCSYCGDYLDGCQQHRRHYCRECSGIASADELCQS